MANFKMDNGKKAKGKRENQKLFQNLMLLKTIAVPYIACYLKPLGFYVCLLPFGCLPHFLFFKMRAV
jgi:hypothetical protein